MSAKILILEDEKDVGQLYVKSLKDKGHKTVLAGDGMEGVQQLRSFQPDLVLLDLGMPNMNGIEFYQHICDTKGKPRYPVLVLTGRTDLESVFKDFNVEGFLIKPFGRQKLLDEIDIILNQESQKSRSGAARRIVIIDQDPRSAAGISDALSKAGYTCTSVHSGTMGIETVLADPPRVAVVNLGLSDYAGDLVILRLQGLAKTRFVKYLLYVERNYSLDRVVMDKLSHKSGVRLMCEYAEPQEIVAAVAGMLEDDG